MGGSDPVRELFVGSTSKDLDSYRLGVSDALFLRVQVRAHLSEDWDTAHVPVVEECRRRLERCDGYLGLFAYYYGWIPDGYQESITHLEYRWAMDKWGKQRPARLAVFMPGNRHPTAGGGASCEAERELRAAAEALARTYPGGPQVHGRKLADFHDEVCGQGRTCNLFADLADLRELAITTGFRWKGRLTAAAAQGRAARSTQQLLDEQLGLLGRPRQIEALKDVMAELGRQPDAPAACAVIVGQEEGGQAELLAALSQLPELRRGRPPVKGRPPLTRYDVPQLISWVAEKVCALEEYGPIVETIQQLAEALHRTLRDQPAVLLLDRIERLDGGLVRFCTDLWWPLYDQLQASCAQIPVPHRLIVVVAAYTTVQPGWAEMTAQLEPEEAVDNFRNLLCLPELKDINARALARWLNDIGVDASPDRVQEITGAVLTDAEGHPDGTPVRVYRRLQGERLWPDGG